MNRFDLDIVFKPTNEFEGNFQLIPFEYPIETCADKFGFINCLNSTNQAIIKGRDVVYSVSEHLCFLSENSTVGTDQRKINVT